MPRISKENYYLDIAETVLERATCLRRVYGAIIVKNDEIISTGYNGAPRGEANCCDVGKCYCREHSTPIDEHAARHGDQYGTCVAVHAEQNAIIQAAKMGISIDGATLYCTHQPCTICTRSSCYRFNLAHSIILAFKNCWYDSQYKQRHKNWYILWHVCNAGNC